MIVAFVTLAALAEVDIALAANAAFEGTQAAASELFELRVRPVFAQRCYACHGRVPNPKGGLRVDSRAGLLRGGSRGPALTPGDAAASLVVAAVRGTHPGLRMPPDGVPLEESERDAIANWVDAGAPWPDAPQSGSAGLPAWPAGFEREGSVPDDATLFYEHRIAPILRMCADCHAGNDPPGELSLETRELALAGGASGPALVPGRPEQSGLFRAVRGARPELAMPPDDPLSAEERADLYTWIAAGAAWPAPPELWWAFRALDGETPGSVSDERKRSSWARTTIDGWVAEAHAREGLSAAPEAAPRALVRRLSFDLTGLPPSPADTAAFVAGPSDTAFERLVDRYLASPRFGERWGRHWLDVARYADTAGDSSDYPIPQARLYRDWVIDAVNDDLPYNEFLRLQIAGDLLAPELPREDYADAITATGFLALARRFGVGKRANPELTIEDCLDTIGRGVLATTLRCARCHDHRYDPLQQRDYYGLYGILASTRFPFPGSENERRPDDLVPLVPPAQREPLEAAFEAQLDPLAAAVEAARESVEEHQLRIDEASRELEALEAKLARLDAEPALSFPRAVGIAGVALALLAQEEPRLRRQTDELPGASAESDTPVERLRLVTHRAATEERGTLVAQRDAVQAELAAIRAALASATADAEAAAAALTAKQAARPRFPLAFAVAEGKPADARLQLGGDPSKLGDAVARGFPTALGGSAPAIPAGESGRRQLAEWLATHPLSARVFVNRVWHHLTGAGLVTTLDNFGALGAAPSHPELLEHLAARFAADGYSLKRLVRRIVRSSVYRQRTPRDAAERAVVPRLAAHARRRLDAESLRDALLHVGGLLELQRPGAHPFPPVDSWNYTQHRPFQAVYANHKRSVYTMAQRIQPHPYLALFDGARTNSSTAGRSESTVPAQALWLLNGDLLHSAALGLAKRVCEAVAFDATRVHVLHELALGRSATQGEVDRALVFLADYAAEAVAEDTVEGRAEAWAALARVVLSSNEFLYID